MKPRPEDVTTVYKEICTSYHAIDDFRMKLMSLLPLVTGAGAVTLFTLIGDAQKVALAQPFFPAIGFFGLVVAFGLFCYELYGIKKCHGLIQSGAELERSMN